MTDPNDSIHVSEKWGFVHGCDGPESVKGIAPGLTKREYFASLAMQGILSNPNSDLIHQKHYATGAVLMADALINELNEKQE